MLSRSSFPFQEILFNELFYDTEGLPKTFDILPQYHLVSLVPSLAKARYFDTKVIKNICSNYVSITSKTWTHKKIDPRFLKLLVERVFAFDQYTES